MRLLCKALNSPVSHWLEPVPHDEDTVVVYVFPLLFVSSFNAKTIEGLQARQG